MMILSNKALSIILALVSGLFASTPILASDQDQPLNGALDLRISFGSFSQSVHYPSTEYRGIEGTPGLSYALHLGFDIPINNKLSVDPGAGLSVREGDIDNYGKEGGNVDYIPGIDAFVLTRYRFENGNCKLIFELGPEFSWFTDPVATYYINPETDDWPGGKEKYKKWDIAIRPGITLQTGKHFQIGCETSLGLRNVEKQYPDYHIEGSRHFFSTRIFIGWRF